ncbi:MAG: hypothetical protein CMN72_15895 [Sphingomonas sp.]|nr:hypothetical protein [Sphingomonas sp.]|tara:strand:- start:236 stop:514 length:279 start_codon:yes stop_codon:yes gene_type:complete
MAQMRMVNGEYQVRLDYSGEALQKSDSFIFEVSTSGLKIMGLLNGVVLDVVALDIDVKKVLLTMFHQKVMRVELVQDNDEVVVLLALNKKEI